MKTNLELKLEAKRSLQGNWVLAIIACIIYGILTGLGGSSNQEINEFESTSFNTTMSILGLILTGPITFGLKTVFLSFTRSQAVTFKSLFDGFSYFLQTFLLHLIRVIFVVLWFLLLIVPGFIALLRYSMAFYIMVDNPGISGLEAIRRSKAMMHGHKGRLFMLWLSFFGWFLLGIITIGLAFLYVAPYYEAALANFYEDLKDNSINQYQ
jgi:uncharacterized membrane protein